MRDRHDHHLFGDEVFHVDVSDFFQTDFSPSFIAESSLDVLEVVFDDRQDVCVITQDAQVLDDLFEQLVVLVTQFLLFQIH